MALMTKSVDGILKNFKTTVTNLRVAAKAHQTKSAAAGKEASAAIDREVKEELEAARANRIADKLESLINDD